MAIGENMKVMAILLIILALVLSACSDKAAKLTNSEINSLQVSDDFDFQTTRSVDISIRGMYLQTVKIYTTNDVLLFRGLVDPEIGLCSRIVLPYSVKQVKLVYGESEETVKVSTSNRIDYSFYRV